MGNLSGFDANTVDPAVEREPVPAGKYQAFIIDSEMKETQAGTGRYMTFTWQIVGGDYQDRKVWSLHNLENPNPKAVEIARKELSSICRAVGVMKPDDGADLYNRICNIKTKIVRSEEFGDKNEITSWSVLEGNEHLAEKEAEPAKKEDGKKVAADQGDEPW